ncbi:MAG TPA: hypothetical protein VKK61_07045 [Tepidisphaeraceae bacterium]|nr:hypothetical protein [Tepidisphaeraceae bacterium]
MKMTRDELEYAISQYLDGTLPPLERATLEDRLGNDAEARGILDEYRRLDSLLKTSPAVPEIAWERFAGQICDAIAKEEMPVRHYSFASTNWIRGLAIAASLLFVVSVAIHFASRYERPTGSANVSGPTVEVAAGPIVSEIGIGPSPAVAANWRTSEEIVSRPTVVLIDQANASAQDSESGLY